MNKTRSAHLHPDAFSTRSWAAMTDAPTAARGKKFYVKTTRTGEKVTTKPGLWARVTGQAVALKGAHEARVKRQLRDILQKQQSPETVKARRFNDKQRSSHAGAQTAVAKTWRTGALRQAMQMQRTSQSHTWKRAALSGTEKGQSALQTLQATAEEPISPQDAANALGDAYHQSAAKAALDGVFTIIRRSSQSLKSISNAVTRPSNARLDLNHQRAIAELKLSTLGQVSLSDLGFEDFEQDSVESRKAPAAVKGARNLARIIGAADNALDEVNSACVGMMNQALHRADDLDGFQKVCKSAVSRMEGQIQHLMNVAQALMTIGERVPDMPDSLCNELAFHGAQLLNLATELANAAGPFGMSHRIAKLAATNPQAAIDLLHKALEPQADFQATDAADNDAAMTEALDALDAVDKAIRAEQALRTEVDALKARRDSLAEDDPSREAVASALRRMEEALEDAVKSTTVTGIRLKEARAAAEGQPLGVRHATASIGNELGSFSGFSWKSPLQKAVDDLASLSLEFGLDPDTGNDALQKMQVHSIAGRKSAVDVSYLNEPLDSFSGFAWPKKPTTMKETEQAFRTARLLLFRAKRSNDEAAKAQAQVRFDQAAALLQSLKAAAAGTSPTTSADDSAAIATTATGDPTEKRLQDRYVAVMDDIDAALKVLNEPRG